MFGIETGDGWKPIAQKVVDEIIKCNKNLPDDSRIYINQVKEKFGELCIYVSYDNVPKETIDYIDKLIQYAHLEAANTCEICGAKENVGFRTNGWYTVMCEDCAKKIVNSTTPYGLDYSKTGIKWKRNSDGKTFIITKEGTKEYGQ